MPDPTPAEMIAALLAACDLPADLGALTLTGAEPALPSSFRLGAAGQASLAAAGLAAAAIWRLRTGQSQGVAVDMRHAAAELRSERYLRRDGVAPGDPWDALAGLYPTAEGWVRLHTNFPHHRDGILRLLGCSADRPAVAAALARQQAVAFETRATEAGMCVAALRDFSEWDAHPQAAALRGMPPLRLTRIADAPPQPMAAGPTRPLSGMRVLELARVIAGPVAGRLLAAHGADVLHLSAPHLPNLPTLVQDTHRGKRTAFLDLGHEMPRMRELVAGADVFLQSYRPGALAGWGLPPEALAAMRPGIVVASLSAYGPAGPWAGKRGFDSLVQTATGFNAAEAAAAGSATPQALPAQALDHVSGHLLALGTMAALHRRVVEGGSWRVEVSLAGTATWLRGLGRLADGLAAPDPDVSDLLDVHGGVEGQVTSLRHAAILSATPAGWAAPAPQLGAGPAAWL